MFKDSLIRKHRFTNKLITQLYKKNQIKQYNTISTKNTFNFDKYQRKNLQERDKYELTEEIINKEEARE